jgi:hypothetical protein
MSEYDNPFARWIAALEPPVITPLLSRWGPPLYARETLYRQVQPYYDQYDDLYREIGATLGTDDETGFWEQPDPKFWKPSRKMAKRLRRLAALREKMWEILPNPDYDPVRAAAWKEQHTYNQQQIKVGQSYHPDVSTTATVHDE